MPRLRWLAVKSVRDGEYLVRELRRVLAKLDPELPLADVQSMAERTSRSLAPRRLAVQLATLFGAVALFLSLCGIYGVLGYVVARRTREIGIRMALGSTTRDVFDLVFREGVALVVGGLVLGLAGAVALAGTLQSQLFGVSPTDPLILGGVAGVTGCAALLACVAPSLRATRVDPVTVLAAE
jgi:ABC-type antimicrobial peptide transport system permease subunit